MKICVYCGSRSGSNPLYIQEASRLGQLLAHNSITLVYGGGKKGMMGAVADEALKERGPVIGIIPKSMMELEWAHPDVSQLHVVATMHERKAMMAELAEAFVALPGGIGTYEELFEVLTWASLGHHEKPIFLLNTSGYYDRIMELLRHTVREGFMSQEKLDHLRIVQTAEELIGQLKSL